MRTPTTVRTSVVTLLLLAGAAEAQVPASELTRTLTVPAPPEGDPPASPVYVRTPLVTTLQFERPLRAATLSGPGAEHITVQRLGPDAVIVRPVSPLPSGEKPTLTVVAEDGPRHLFTLVTDTDEVDVQVRVQRGQCLTADPEDLDALAAELLLREPVRNIRKLLFQQQIVDADTENARLKIWGTLPMSQLAVVTLRIDSDANPFEFGRAHFKSPIGRLKVLGARPDAEGNISIVVRRPVNEADGVAYTLTVSERNGHRELVARNVVPWPILPASTAREPLGPEGPAKTDPNGRGRNGEVPRSKLRQRR